jgi:hypothetical protein
MVERVWKLVPQRAQVTVVRRSWGWIVDRIGVSFLVSVRASPWSRALGCG